MNAVVIPMVLAAVGVLASIIGSLLVKTGEDTDQSTLLKALRRGTNTSEMCIRDRWWIWILSHRLQMNARKPL